MSSWQSSGVPSPTDSVRRRRLAIAFGGVVLAVVGALGVSVVRSRVNQPMKWEASVLLAGELGEAYERGTGPAVGRGEYSRYERVGSCHGIGGYADLRAGTPLVVRDDKGSIVAVAELDSGEIRAEGCYFESNWKGPNNLLPKRRAYSVEVSHRGQVTFAFEDLTEREAGWFYFPDLRVGAG